MRAKTALPKCKAAFTSPAKAALCADLGRIGKGLACTFLVPRDRGKTPVVAVALQEPEGFRSYSPLEGHPAQRRTRMH